MRWLQRFARSERIDAIAAEGEVQGTKVTCPWHGADFDIKTGAVLGPPAQNSVPSYKVMVDGDDIKVEV